MHTVESEAASDLLEKFKQRLQAGEIIYLVGVGPAGHNSGVSLVEVSEKGGICLISNDEEERFVAVKHCEDFPEQAFSVLRRRLAELGLQPTDVHAFLATWSYPDIAPLAISCFAGEFPASWQLLHRDASPTWSFMKNVIRGRRSPRRIQETLELPERPKVIGMPHHENHASFAYASSPFAGSGERVAITVLDGFGDEGAISLYLGEKGKLSKLRANFSLCDSLGAFYSIISSTQGGWTTLSSEGRYMGAVAWGDQNRLTNRFYRSLREILHLGPEGEVQINRSLARWHLSGERRPYQTALVKLIGDPIPRGSMWNPDAVLNTTDVEHSDFSKRRVDIAAATQMVFEDAVFHIVEHLIRSERISRLVMSGGTALNCLANMALLDRFDREWYRRNMGIDSRLEIWIPPTPSDSGVTMGAAYSFALRGGARPSAGLRHAFYCGLPPTEEEVVRAFVATPQVGFLPMGHASLPSDIECLADRIAWVIQRGGILGLFQGVAETGPRALGHRSILANACDESTLSKINAQVKFREPIRPLAPMVTREAAEELFELSEGASADDYNSYNYMVLTVRARPHARKIIPAVIHRDGTARIQIVRSEIDPLCHAVLRALGRRIGVEAMVNTSLNVGSPITQTPTQALEALCRALAMTGLVIISDEGIARIAYPKDEQAPKDGGKLLMKWMAEYDSETTVCQPSLRHRRG